MLVASPPVETPRRPPETHSPNPGRWVDYATKSVLDLTAFGGAKRPPPSHPGLLAIGLDDTMRLAVFFRYFGSLVWLGPDIDGTHARGQRRGRVRARVRDRGPPMSLFWRANPPPRPRRSASSSGRSPPIQPNQLEHPAISNENQRTHHQADTNQPYHLMPSDTTRTRPTTSFDQHRFREREGARSTTRTTGAPCQIIGEGIPIE